MSTQLYTQCYVTVDGKILMEEASVTVTRTSGSQAVMTVGRGYAGESLGAPTVEIQVSGAIPVAGFEFNAQDHLESLAVIELGVICAGVALVAKGFIVQDSIKHSVNQESTYDFTFRGEFAKFE